MKTQFHRTTWIKKADKTPSQSPKNVSHAEEDEAASSSHTEQALRGMQEQKDRATRHHILRGMATSSPSTKQPSHKQTRGGVPVNVQPHTPDLSSRAPNRASKPYTPIIVCTPAYCGAQKKSSISSTNYARQAAELLIDYNGSLDRTHIAAMLHELNAVAARPPEQQMLSDYHRKHVSNTLGALLEDDKLATTINQICEHKSLRGTAADLVRATLNMPPEQTSLGKAEARKAVVMSLLGNLRQKFTIGSCFATAPAIALHREAPGVVASDLKELLENNSLVMKSGNVISQVPLNSHVSRAEAQIKLYVRSDGTCFGKASGQPGEPHWLHQTPGMAAALTALGIPEQHRQYYVSMTLQQMGVRGHGLYGISPQQIIEYLACATDGKGLHPGQHTVAALNAFSGAEDVRLLRAWEYTLATHSNAHNNNQEVMKFSDAVLDPAFKINSIFLQSLSSSPEFRNVPVAQLNQELFNDVLNLMHLRFFIQYDTDVEQPGISADGVSQRGGHVLYDRIPFNEPSQWQRIDNPAIFQATMAHLVEEAARNTRFKAVLMGGDPPLNQQALYHLIDSLKQYIGHPDFAAQTAIRFNSCSGGGNVIDPFSLPWKQARGGSPIPIMENYGSIFPPAARIFPVSPACATGDGSTQIGKPDASSMVYSLLNAQIAIGVELRNKARTTKGEFYTPLRLDGVQHVCSLIPTEMAEVWQHADPSKNLAPQQWIDKHLVQPAQAYLDKKRTTPQLHDLLQSIGDKTGMIRAQLDAAYKQISLKDGSRGGQQAYTLHDVHEALSQKCARYPNAAELQDRMENELARMVPPPPEMAKRITDTNGEDEEGNPIYLGVKHNPFVNKIEANFINDKGKITSEVEANCLFGEQFVGTPLAAAMV